MLDQNDDKMVSLNPQGPDKTSTNVNGDGSDSAITLVLAIFSTIIPFLGFILTCVYWSSNRFRSWLCFGLGWIPTIAGLVLLGYFLYIIYDLTHHDY
ncbi:hypothetical protein TVAG_219710 [Trichomonas vaginalis G3]|uniref:Transmembrane protein n=1 Tax=Trichomonas vaginalis (strain ATCC PRA-98 / G3) TaxID=412133 RepID=A2DXS9_TRIV3|nr:hypothetical protein TVAGG3_0683390 [Trichomonas vaginalis G3]EAY14789.1 hypothetical protein TVAG_219710 [Trichomonas vaginalis G3]KAI5508064.1 hypothetical protein TVAGG3_0683390 [Trichomonas vaginalis G3]|eukprot:XP_001327012.1 hypothetical protein [Trichomonas vaginalis G3]